MIFKKLRIATKMGTVQSLLIKEEYAAAADLAKQILKLSPPNFQEAILLMQIGEAHYYTNSMDEALVCFNKAIGIYKTFPKQEPIDSNNQSIGRAVKFIEAINGGT